MKDHWLLYWARSKRRIRFAWWPVRLWKHYKDEFGCRGVRPTWRMKWLCPVVEVKTLDGWTAYEDYQRILSHEARRR